MSESGFASLGPSLLARKGGAKPAMRPQLAPLVPDNGDMADDHLEDLGWNDMGDAAGDGLIADFRAEDGANIVPINGGVGASDLTQGPSPVVRRQQRSLEERVLADAAMTGPEDREPEYDEYEQDEDEQDDDALYGEDYAEQLGGAAANIQAEHVANPIASLPVPITLAAATLRKPAVQSGRRAAFTLRLDTDRHLKLRLAATMQGVSAQVLVTEALDRMLSEYGDLDGIANQLKRH